MTPRKSSNKDRWDRHRVSRGEVSAEEAGEEQTIPTRENKFPLRPETQGTGPPTRSG